MWIAWILVDDDVSNQDPNNLFESFFDILHSVISPFSCCLILRMMLFPFCLIDTV